MKYKKVRFVIQINPYKFYNLWSNVAQFLECLTREREVAGLNSTAGAVLCPSAKRK